MTLFIALGNMVDLREVRAPEQRLLLVGGFSGFLKTMENHKVPPDNKTFTMLLDNIPNTEAAETALLRAVQKAKIKPDIDFLNMLIKKRSMRFDYEKARSVLYMFDKYGYSPNIFTYGILALCCETLEDAQGLLDDMFDNGYRINIEILGALLRQACVKENFVYILQIMELVAKENIHTNKQFMDHLESFHKSCVEKIKEGKQVNIEIYYCSIYQGFETE